MAENIKKEMSNKAKILTVLFAIILSLLCICVINPQNLYPTTAIGKFTSPSGKIGGVHDISTLKNPAARRDIDFFSIPRMITRCLAPRASMCAFRGLAAITII